MLAPKDCALVRTSQNKRSYLERIQKHPCPLTRRIMGTKRPQLLLGEAVRRGFELNALRISARRVAYVPVQQRAEQNDSLRGIVQFAGVLLPYILPSKRTVLVLGYAQLCSTVAQIMLVS